MIFVVIAYVLTAISCCYLIIQSLIRIIHKRDVFTSLIIFCTVSVILFTIVCTIPNLTLL